MTGTLPFTLVFRRNYDIIKLLKPIIRSFYMYPLLLKPPVKDYLWGGTKLKTDYHFETDKAVAAEAFLP